jgi:hypothetical protein
MFPASSLVTTITTDRIREAETARLASQSNRPEPAEPRCRRPRRPLVLATRGAVLRSR